MEVSYNQINAFLTNCNYCATCSKVCPFIKKYGLPSEIIKKNSEDVFLCTNCGACNSVCAEKLKPAKALHLLKSKLINNNELSIPTKNAIKASRNFALRGHRLPFVHYEDTEVGFWPGCSLVGAAPFIVNKINNMLKEKFKNVKVVLDCCFDPAFQNGDINFVQNAADRIRERLNKHSIKKLIFGCGNCKKIFNLFIPEVDSQHIVELLDFPESCQNKAYFKDGVYLHHPCPSFKIDEIQKNVVNKLSKTVKIASMHKIPMCCGLGGASNALSPELSEEFAKKVFLAAESKPILTYCMGCKNRFIKRGVKSYHIFELLVDGEFISKPASSTKKWINRFLYSTYLKVKSIKFLVTLLIIILVIASLYLQHMGVLAPEKILAIIKSYKFLSPLVFLLIYSIGPSIFLPSLPLTLAAGVIWGPFWGVIFAITGATIGASVAFLLSRYIMAETVKKKFGYDRWNWLKERVEQHGWKAVAFARLLPVLPFPVLNYLFGVTPISFLQYLWSSFLFMLPACIAYVVFGHSMGELIFTGNIKPVVFAILIISILMLLPMCLKSWYRKIMGKVK